MRWEQLPGGPLDYLSTLQRLELRVGIEHEIGDARRGNEGLTRGMDPGWIGVAHFIIRPGAQNRPNTGIEIEAMAGDCASSIERSP